MNAPLKIGRLPMIRISLPWIFELSEQLQPLSRLPDQPTVYNEVWLPLITAEGALQTLSIGSIFTPYLLTSWALSQQLLANIRTQTQQTDTNRQLTQFELWSIKNTYGQYRTALLAELGALNAYFVTQKGGFDMYTLLISGETLFPADMGAKVPEAVIDAREAAKALAYEVPTSCGFHTFRVTEAILRKYYAQVTGGAALPKVRNIGVYLNALKQAKKGDEKILAALKQMIDLHRNPLIHPDVVLTLDEAIATLGIARSVITAMLAALPIKPPTTTTVAVA